jgi:antitoxin VapB
MPSSLESTAKVFMSGSSQAVRLPKAFRFDVDEVAIRKEGDEVILSPLKPRPWPKGYWASFGPLGDDFEVPEPLPRSPKRDKILEKL